MPIFRPKTLCSTCKHEKNACNEGEERVKKKTLKKVKCDHLSICAEELIKLETVLVRKCDGVRLRENSYLVRHTYKYIYISPCRSFVGICIRSEFDLVHNFKM